MAEEFDDLSDVPIDLESLMYHREMEKLDPNEQKEAEMTVLGYSATAIGILNRLSKGPDNAENHFGGLPEHPRFLSLKFGELDVQIKKIEGFEVDVSSRSGRRKRDPDFEAYKLAREQDPKFIDHPLFKISFLRADRYNARKAAKRLLRYLREKLELFGRDKLTRDIFLDDLGAGGKKYLECNGLQVLPKRDNAGRKIVFVPWIADQVESDEEILSARRAFFYFCQSLIEDDNEYGRVKGVVAIMWKVRKSIFANSEKANALPSIWLNSPLKTSAFHVCHGPKSSFSLTSLNVFAKNNLALWFRDSYLPRLYRAHYGEAVECMYILYERYGCPADCFPLNHGSPENKFPPLDEAGGNNGVLGSQCFHFHHVAVWLADRIQVDDQKELLMSSMISSDGKMNISTIGSLLSSGSLGNSSLSGLDSSGVMAKMANSLNGSLATKKRHSMSIAMVEMTGNVRSSRNSGHGYSPTSTKYSVDTLRSSELSLIDQLSLIKGDLALEDDLSFESILNEIPGIEVSLDFRPSHENEPGGSSAVGHDGNRNRNNDVTLQTMVIDDSIPDCDVFPRDIKLGRGKPLQYHPGNIWYRAKISDEFEAYDALPKSQQTPFSESIVKLIESEGRRFLTPHPVLKKTHWLQLTDQKAREKVSISFRSERAKRGRKPTPNHKCIR